MYPTGIDRRREHLETSATNESSGPTSRGSGTSSGTSTPAGGPSDSRLGATLERLPVSADYSAFLANLHTNSSSAPGVRVPSHVDTTRTPLVRPTLGNARDAATQQRLDAFRDRFSGPYEVGGTKVTAPPMFRMNTPDSFNALKMTAHAPELARICAKAGIASAAGPASVGRCTPEQLVKVTQALLDAGKLPPADDKHKSLDSRIRAMQWEWGIGVDCAGYTQQAAADAHGVAGEPFKANLTGDIFSGMKNDRRFQSVGIGQIRAGDVLHLDAPTRGAVGHNVVCHSHTTLNHATGLALFQRAWVAPPTPPNGQPAADPVRFTSAKGPFHTFEVDSSWGADDGEVYGGFRRDTWLYDEGSATWASYPRGDRATVLFANPETGPQGELFGGAFRPREPR